MTSRAVLPVSDRGALALLLALLLAVNLVPAQNQTPANTARPLTWTDPDTHLMWAANDNGAGVTQPQALDYCRALPLAGYHNWRLPTIDELAQIYDPSAAVPSGVARIKGGISLPSREVTAFTWSSSPQADSEQLFWGLWFYNGTRVASHGGNSGAGNRALCVRREGEAAYTPPPPPAASWTDPNTGLTWTTKDNGSEIDHYNAAQYCRNLTLGGNQNPPDPPPAAGPAIAANAKQLQDVLNAVGRVEWTTTVQYWQACPNCTRAAPIAYWEEVTRATVNPVSCEMKALFRDNGSDSRQDYDTFWLDNIGDITVLTTQDRMNRQDPKFQLALSPMPWSVDFAAGSDIKVRDQQTANQIATRLRQLEQQCKAVRYWRLPTVSELQAIYDPSAKDASGKHIKGSIGTTTSVWSNEVDPSSSNNSAWAMKFNDGVPFSADRHDIYNVRALCVRSAAK